jgi:hypothetical protein
MAPLSFDVDVERVRANLAEVRAEIAAAARQAGRSPSDVELLAATKYVSEEQLGLLAEAGINLVGENRADALAAKARRYGDLYTYDFIGTLQSRRVPSIAPYVRLIHSAASQSALTVLSRCIDSARPGLALLIEVNVAGEESKAGVAPAQLPALIELAPVPVVGLSTMPPAAKHPEDSRRWFAALRELADSHGLQRLSMGTTQDYGVAVQEGATIVRIGSRLFA